MQPEEPKNPPNPNFADSKDSSIPVHQPPAPSPLNPDFGGSPRRPGALKRFVSRRLLPVGIAVVLVAVGLVAFEVVNTGNKQPAGNTTAAGTVPSLDTATKLQKDWDKKYRYAWVKESVPLNRALTEAIKNDIEVVATLDSVNALVVRAEDAAKAKKLSSVQVVPDDSGASPSWVPVCPIQPKEKCLFNTPEPAPSGSTAAGCSAPPANTAPPTVSGNFQVTQYVSTTTGSWQSTASCPITAYAYRWYTCATTSPDSCSTGSYGSSTYKLTLADAGKYKRSGILACNAVGCSSAYVKSSNAGGPVSSSTSPTPPPTPPPPPPPPPPLLPPRRSLEGGGPLPPCASSTLKRQPSKL